MKLAEIRMSLWYYVALELKGEDPYKFLRAFTGGKNERKKRRKNAESYVVYQGRRWKNK